VKASDPAGIVSVLEGAGYDANLSKDSVGDPKITVELGGHETSILFYGCDEKTHTGCDSVQFVVGFDHESGLTAEQALELSRNYRFITVELDDERDPFIRWDVVIGEGIPSSVFLRSVLRFSEAIDYTSQEVFKD